MQNVRINGRVSASGRPAGASGQSRWWPSLPQRRSCAASALLLLAALNAAAAPAAAGDATTVAGSAASPATTASAAAADANPLLGESRLPFHYPPFDRIRAEHFLPAIEQGMAERLAEVEAIADNPAPPTFDNTVVALERSGRLLTRASSVFFSLNATVSSPALQQTARVLAPKLAAHNDAVRLNAKLFARIDALYRARDTLALDRESQRLLWRYQQDFVRFGALLSHADKAALRTLNAELATLQNTFAQNVLKEREASAVLFDRRDDLAGLGAAQLAAAADAAKAAGHDGAWLLQLVNTSGQPVLAELRNPASRAKVMAASLARGSRGGAYDNRAVVLAIARKRAERAALLGYPNHAAYQLAEQTIGSVDAVNRLLAQMAPAAVANARAEAAAMLPVVQEDAAGVAGATAAIGATAAAKPVVTAAAVTPAVTPVVTAADWARGAEQVRAARYAIDESQTRPYFELNRVLQDGVFYAAGRLYGLQFKERRDLPVYESSVRVFDVFEADGRRLAIFLFDPYARPNKRGGAWANAYERPSGLLGGNPVVANHLNIPKPPDGEPTLLTDDEVKTAFHEFGHALHMMFLQVQYPRLAGVPSDFVEYPSQVNEMWALWPEVLQHYARHFRTGEPMPRALLDKIAAQQRFNQGFLTTEYLAATLLDQAWHQAKTADLPPTTDVLAFEAAALRKAGVDFAAVPPRYRSTYFSHVMEGGYAAGYYSYIWSEVLDADSVDYIRQHGGLKRENGDRFRATVLSRGGSDDPLKMFRDFTGGDPDIQPLLLRRGLSTSVEKPTVRPGAVAMPAATGP